MAYWQHTFSLGELGDCLIELHSYSSKCIALRSPSKFGRAFSKHFKEIGGKYNANLKFSDRDTKQPGWIFKMDDQAKIQEVLKKINSGELTPRKLHEKSQKDEFEDVYRKLVDLIKVVPEEGSDDIVIAEKDGFRTYASFNKCETTDDLIVYFGTSKKKMYVYKVKM